MLYITTNGGDTVLLLLRATTTSSFSTALLELLVRLLFLPHVAEQHRRRSTMGKGQGALGYAATGSHDDHSLTLPPSLAATLVLLALQLSVALSPGAETVSACAHPRHLSHPRTSLFVLSRSGPIAQLAGPFRSTRRLEHPCRRHGSEASTRKSSTVTWIPPMLSSCCSLHRADHKRSICSLGLHRRSNRCCGLRISFPRGQEKRRCRLRSTGRHGLPLALTAPRRHRERLSPKSWCHSTPAQGIRHAGSSSSGRNDSLHCRTSRR